MNVNSSGASILHQPVHIATPAPSPPPSPAVGGKAGKKQNYQTNQNFPFMYPPLDSTSNSAGGKGQAGLQGSLVGRKWGGSDIPKSILEAGELFAGRMRMTRAMRQLWDEREKFLKFERGWDAQADHDVDEFDLETLLAKKLEVTERKPVEPEIDYGPNKDVDDNVKMKLELVEVFYVSAISAKSGFCTNLLPARINTTHAISCDCSTESCVSKRHGSYHSSNGWSTCGNGHRISIRSKSSKWPTRTTANGSSKYTATKQHRPDGSTSFRN